MRLNPLKLYKDLRDIYVGFLETYWNTRYSYLNEKINAIKNPDNYIKGPYLQIIPPYLRSRSVKELIDEEVLHPQTLNIFGNIHLYEHQERVIRNVVQNKRNTLIATGTGSGKTKAFLIPVIDYVLKVKKDKPKGVKAIFLYPMNALVNDQLKELRKVLKGTKITFGRYTGDTPYDKKDYDKKYGEQAYEKDKKECPEELLTREEILSEIPDLLITNYSMLEYLLLRPKDSPLFDKKTWKFIVIDEIHVYNGAKGAEIGYLLRRLKNRAFEDKLICIGASATLGKNNSETLKKAAEFAQDIFGEPFDERDVITSKTVELHPNGKPWFKDLDLERILEIAESGDLSKLKEKLKSENKDISLSGQTIEELLYEFFRNYEGLYTIIKILKKEPKTISDLISVVPESKSSIKEENKIIALIELLFRASKKEDGREQQRLLNARYHFLLRSPEGVYATLNDNGTIDRVFFEKKIKEKDRKVFQLATCRICGEVFLTGYKRENENGISVLDVDPDLLKDPFRIDTYKRVFIFLSKEKLDKSFIEGGKGKGNAIEIWFNLETGEFAENIGGDDSSFYAYELLQEETIFNQPKKCPTCGVEGKKYKKGRWVSYFTPAEEYPQASILEVVYRNVVENSGKAEDKKVIVFSDSRKDAAFFAPFFEDFYMDRWRTWVIYSQLKDTPIDYEKIINLSLNCIASSVQKNKKNIKDKFKIEFEGTLLEEFVLNDSQSLERLGLAKFMLNEDIEKEALKDLRFLKEYGLNESEIKNLLYYILTGLRENRIVGDNIDVLEQTWVIWKENPPKRNRRDATFIPKKENKRIRLISKILKTKDKTQIVEILNKLWEVLTNTGILKGNRERYLDISKWAIVKNEIIHVCNKCRRIHVWNVKNICLNDKCKGVLEPAYLDSIPRSKALKKLFKSVECHEFLNYIAKAQEHTAQLAREEGSKIQEDFKKGIINILSSSTTFELGIDLGELQVVFLHNVPPRPDNYVQRAGRSGRSTESTAIVITYALNRPFDIKTFADPMRMIKGEISPPIIKLDNKRIILRHLNAIALSRFLRKEFKNHDKITVKDFLDKDGFTKFENYLNAHPEEVKEDIKNVLNQASLISEFGVESWKWWKGSIDVIENKNSKELWNLVKNELEHDISELENIINDLTEQAKESLSKRNFGASERLSKLANIYQTNLEQLYNQDIISFLSRKVFIPKYGFPVDVVSLDIWGHKELSSKIQLDRDLGIAISEYAPGEKLIALGYLIASTHVKISEKLKPELFEYKYCKECLSFNDGRRLNTQDAEFSDKQCDICGSDNVEIGFYIIPRGFVVKNISDIWNQLDKKIQQEIEEIINQKSSRVILPVGKMSADFKPINISKVRTFFKSIEGEAIKKTKKVNGFEVTPYNRGILVKLNLSEGKKVRLSDGLSLSWLDKGIGRTTKDIASLGYSFYTDVLSIAPDFNLANLIGNDEDIFSGYLSLMYAIIEGACDLLNIKREDIDGVLKPSSNDNYELIIYDNVPAGAGFIEDIYERFEEVLEKAKKLVEECKCDDETVCAECLLHFSNQMFAKRLKRGLAKKILERVLSIT